MALVRSMRLSSSDLVMSVSSSSRMRRSNAATSATRAFGLAFRVDDELNERYLGFGIDLEKASGENHHVLPAPATYIIGTDGIINFAYINPDYKVRLHPDILLAAARAYTGDADKRLEARRKQAMSE